MKISPEGLELFECIMTSQFNHENKNSVKIHFIMSKSKSFEFDGGAGTYWLNSFLAFLITILTLGICYPYALVLKQRWIAHHTIVEGRRLKFTGTGIGLFGNWVKWLVLIVITIGIYSIWVTPRVHKWVVEHTDFA